MLDIRYIRENVDKVKKATADKQLDPKLVDKVFISTDSPEIKQIAQDA